MVSISRRLMSVVLSVFASRIFLGGPLGLIVTFLVMFFGNVYEVADGCAG